MVNVLVQSPMVSRRRSSTRMVKRDSLNRMGSIGPISRRGSLLGADGQPSSPSKGPRDEEHADLTGSARPPAGPTIKEERSLEELPHVDSEELQGRTAGSGARSGLSAKRSGDAAAEQVLSSPGSILPQLDSCARLRGQTKETGLVISG